MSSSVYMPADVFARMKDAPKKGLFLQRTCCNMAGEAAGRRRSAGVSQAVFRMLSGRPTKIHAGA
jgi:hypothetical protein